MEWAAPSIECSMARPAQAAASSIAPRVASSASLARIRGRLALASRKDSHGDLNTFLRDEKQGQQLLRRHKWVGDVAYRPYSAKGPILQSTPTRAVTLFELSELVALSRQQDKHVVLASGPCRRCGRTREDALLPLLKNRQLKLWTHLVMDLGTAENLINLERDNGGSGLSRKATAR